MTGYIIVEVDTKNIKIFKDFWNEREEWSFNCDESLPFSEVKENWLLLIA